MQRKVKVNKTIDLNIHNHCDVLSATGINLTEYVFAESIPSNKIQDSM